MTCGAYYTGAALRINSQVAHNPETTGTGRTRDPDTPGDPGMAGDPGMSSGRVGWFDTLDSAGCSRWDAKAWHEATRWRDDWRNSGARTMNFLRLQARLIQAGLTRRLPLLPLRA